MNSDRESLTRIKEFINMQKQANKSIAKKETVSEEAAQTAIYSLDATINATGLKIEAKLEKLGVTFPNPQPPDEGLSNKKKWLISNLIALYAIEAAKHKALHDVLIAGDEYNQNPSNKVKKTWQNMYSEVFDAVLQASRGTVNKIGYEMCQGYTPRFKDPTPNELAHDFLTGFVASEKVSDVRKAVNMGRPENLTDATLLELRTGVYMQEPDSLTIEEFASMPVKVKGEKEGVAKINKTTESEVKENGFKPVTSTDDWNMEQKDNCEEWLKAFTAQEHVAGIVAAAELSKRERQYIEVVLKDPELYLDKDGGNIAVAQEMNVKANNATQIKFQCFKKLRQAAERKVA